MIRQKWEPRPELSIPDFLKTQITNPLIRQRLTQLGITHRDTVESFLNPTLYKPTSAFDLPDMETAVNRIQKAIDEQERIGIWGDFDVDGQTSTTLLVEAIGNLGGKVVYHIPNRQKESHGIKLNFLKEFCKNNINLLITCDTGVSEHESISYANEIGIDVIITDHHSLPETLPEAVAVVNPQRLPLNHPLKNLAGVGTVFKVIEAVYQRTARSDECDHFLDLVALGTIADVAILTGENRYLVQKGLQQLRRTDRLGLQEIFKLKEINVDELTETHISFILAPMLNSLGRLDDANPIVDFLTTSNIQKIKTFSVSLNNLNEKRKLLTDQITQAVLSKIELNPEIGQRSIIIVAQEYWHPGILGIVANRIVEQMQKPVILLSGDKQHGLRGSARSIEGLNIIEFIREQQKFLEHFGGHAMAAGLSIQSNNLDLFTTRIDQSIREKFGSGISENILYYDLEVKPHEITPTFIDEFMALAPFGAGNPQFLFCIKNVLIKKNTQLGKNQRHSKLTIENDQNQELEILWWNSDPDMIDDNPLDIIFTLNKSTYKNQIQTQMELISFQPSKTSINNLIRKQNELIIEDFRTHPADLANIFQDNPDSKIWYEGVQDISTQTYDRFSIGPCHTLIIAFLPPGLRDILKVIRTCRPIKIILNPVSFNQPSQNEIIRLVGQMLKYSINHHQGIINTQKMAGRIGQRISLIEIIIEWLAAKGQIEVFRHPDTNNLIKSGGIIQPQLAEQFENQLIFLLKETNAFQFWFQNTSIEKLKQELFLY